MTAKLLNYSHCLHLINKKHYICRHNLNSENSMKKRITTYTRALLLLVLVLGFTACQDEESIRDRLIGRTWIGDLGFSDEYGDALESGLTFKSNGFGLDRQFYYVQSRRADFELEFRWILSGNDLRLDYGTDRDGYPYPILEIRGLYIDRDVLYGVLYVNGKYDGDIELGMEF